MSASGCRCLVLPARQGIPEETLRKPALAPNVPISFIAVKTEGVSGVDPAELCQRAAKADIRVTIAAEERKAGDDDIDVEAASEIRRKQFEEAFAGAQQSVATTDLAKYDQFRKKFDLVYMDQSSGDGGYAFVHGLGGSAVGMFVSFPTHPQPSGMTAEAHWTKEGRASIQTRLRRHLPQTPSCLCAH